MLESVGISRADKMKIIHAYHGLPEEVIQGIFTGIVLTLEALEEE